MQLLCADYRGVHVPVRRNFFGKVQSVLNLIGQLFMLIGIGIPAYDYTRGKKIAWKVIYWVALAIYLFGCVFGIIRAF